MIISYGHTDINKNNQLLIATYAAELFIKLNKQLRFYETQYLFIKLTEQ